MLMITPLMIWSALTVIESQACSSAEIMPDMSAAAEADEQRQCDAEDRRRVTRRSSGGNAIAAPVDPADERGGQHHALEADVDDADRSLTTPHRAAKSDRRWRPRRDRRDNRQLVDQVTGGTG